MARVRLPTLVLALALVAIAPTAARAETTVPLDLQVELLRKVVRFERGFAGRATKGVTVIVVLKRGNAASERAASQLGKALGGGAIAGKTAKVTAVTYASAAALKTAVTQGGAQLVYLTPGFESELAAIAEALAGVPTITVSTDAGQVDRGAVLGFNLVASRPKLELNIAQAKRQSLDFNSELFRLARIVK